MTYEFNEEEAETMWIFGNKTAIVGVIFAASGVIGMILSILQFGGDNSARAWTLFFEYIVLIVMGVILYRPSDNFKNIAITEGSDVPELMQGMKDFTFAFTVTAILVFFIGLLNFFLIMSKV